MSYYNRNLPIGMRKNWHVSVEDRRRHELHLQYMAEKENNKPINKLKNFMRKIISKFKKTKGA